MNILFAYLIFRSVLRAPPIVSFNHADNICAKNTNYEAIHCEILRSDTTSAFNTI